MGEPLRLYGLKALVMSGASGIGEAVSRTLAKHGAAVLAVDSVNSGAEQHFKSVKGIDGVSSSLTDVAKLPALIEEGVEKLGRLDILVNEFPLQSDGPIDDDGERFTELLADKIDRKHGVFDDVV